MLRPIVRQRLVAQTAALSRAAFTAPHVSAASRAMSSFPVADPAFWKAMIPKPFRRTQDPAKRRKKSRLAAFKIWMAKDWNPATFFIIIFLLIGSMSINSITLKKGFETYMRQSEVRIGLLREVVEKLQRGEKVDVERVLGTGVPENETEWQDVINELEREDIARGQKKKDISPAPMTKGEPTPTPKEEQSRIETVVAPSRDFF